MKQTINTFKCFILSLSTALFLGFPLSYAQDENEPVEELEEYVAEEEVDDPTGILPSMPVESVFGFSQDLIDLPRSVSSISGETLEQYGITDINGLVAFSPGAFTTSFFGVAGQLDIRGAPGETYFRGMKRIENPGNYQTPIGASDRVDVVRGPPSPIYGAGKIGGYLNFIPKTGRARTGKYFEKPRGQFQGTFGSWDKRILSAEVTGPVELANRKGGFSIYLMNEDSGSYYNNSFTRQTIVQSTLVLDLNEKWRMEVGELYQHFASTENAGWNRVTQALIDDGTYTAGRPLINADDPANGGDSSGEIDQSEAANIGGLFFFLDSASGFDEAPFGPGFGGVPPSGVGGPNENLALDPATVHTAHIDGNQVLIDKTDRLLSDSTGIFLDFINDSNPNFIVKNKIFIDVLKRNKRASYGFSQVNNVFSFEEKLVLEGTRGRADELQFQWQLASSVRNYDSDSGEDFDVETFDRRDLSFLGGTGTPFDRRAASLDDPGKNPWTRRYQTEFREIGQAAMLNITWKERFHLMGGGRFTDIDFDSFDRPGTNSDTGGQDFSSRKSEWGYTWSATVDTPWGFNAYVTNAKQPLLTTDQSGGVLPALVDGGDPFANTSLWEGGIKGKFLKGKLFIAVDAYQQTLASFNSQTLTITATRGTGYEFELRYVPSAAFSFAVAANWQKTVYRPLNGANSCFQFLNPEQATFLTGVPSNGADFYAGTLGSSDSCREDVLKDFEERPGVPDKTISFNTTYTNPGGWGISVSGTYIPSVAADRLKVIELPSAFVLNGSVFYGTKKWQVKITGKNLLDERYFRGNFPGLFGGVTVLPQLPISAEATLTYRF